MSLFPWILFLSGVKCDGYSDTYVNTTIDKKESGGAIIPLIEPSQVDLSAYERWALDY